MGLYLSTESGSQIPLASNAGWSGVGDWIERLDGDYPDLQHLWEHGWAEPASELRMQLDRAIKADPPSGDAAKTAAELLSSLRALDPDSAVVVSDGMEE